MVFCLSATIQQIKQIDTSYKPAAGQKDEDMTTLFYSLAPAPGMGSTLRLLEKDFRFDIRNAADVRQFFRKYAVLQNKADNYMLFTWGHGAAYGLFAPSSTKPTQLGSRKPVPWDMLTAKGLTDAITGAFGKGNQQKVRLVVCMNCYMQLLDTGLALAQAGIGYYVAPENVEMSVGYNYRDLFGFLFKGEGVTGEALARLAITSLPQPVEGKPDPLGSTSVFANDLSKYSALAQAVSDLGNELRGQLPDGFCEIKKLVAASRAMAGFFWLIDVFRFAEGVGEGVKKGRVRELADAVAALRECVVMESHFGSAEVAAAPDKYALGVSVCFPPNSKQANNIPFYITYIQKSSPYASWFSKQYDWSSFLRDFLAMDQQGVVCP